MSEDLQILAILALTMVGTLIVTAAIIFGEDAVPEQMAFHFAVL